MDAISSNEKHLLGGTIGFLDKWQATLITQCESASALRLFACAMTRFALSQPVTIDPLCQRGVETAECYARGECSEEELNQVGSKLKNLAEELEDNRINLSELEEKGTVSEDESVDISTRAMIAKAALACTYKPAILAAVCAAYEVEYAINIKFYSEDVIERNKRKIAELLQNK